MKNNEEPIVIKEGIKFNRLTVIEKAYEIPSGTLWLCQCDCGLKQDVLDKDLISGNIKCCENCNFGKQKDIDYTSKVFGGLTVISEVESIRSRCGRITRRFRCECLCGKNIIVKLCDLKSGKITSCGCKRQSIARLREIWNGIKYRTDPKKCKNKYTRKNYIDRGIILCKEWNDFENFKEWSFNNGYFDTLTIDRIDNDKGYCPNNCRWVTQRQNSCNKRNNIKLPNGHSFCDLLWHVGILSNTPLYGIYLNYYKKTGELHPSLKKRIADFEVDINNII